jgi:hypothetical protein
MGYIFNNGYGGNKMPGLVFQGSNGAYGGHGFAADTGYAPWNEANPTFTLRDDAGKTWGKHNLQWGFWGSFVQQNEVSGVTGANSGEQQGMLTFSNQGSIYTSNNAFADFLAGQGSVSSSGGIQAPAVPSTAIKSYTQDSGLAKYYNRNKTVDLYLQDDWHLLPHLTVNLGLRASFLGPWYNDKGTAYNWEPGAFSTVLGSDIELASSITSGSTGNSPGGYLVQKSTGDPITLSRTGPYSLTGTNALDQHITNGLVQCGANGVSNSCMKNTLFHPSPRVGFSWDPWGDGKTAIRAGYGLFWEHGTSYEANVGSLIGSAPTVLSETQSNISTGAYMTNNSDPKRNAYNMIGLSCQGGALQCGSNTTIPGGATSASNGATFPLNVTSIPAKATYSYTQQWSLSVQREVRKGMMGQLAYVGTKGTHLTAVRDLNQLQPLANGLNPFSSGEPITSSVCQSGGSYGYFSVLGLNSGASGAPITITTSPGIGPHDPGYQNMLVACLGNPGFGTSGITPDSVRQYLGFSNIISVENIADSKYHALQGTLRQTTGSLTIALAYTYSHSIDDSSDRSSANFTNSLDLRSNKGNSDFDQRHMLNISYIYDLPFLKLLDGFSRLIGSTSDEDDDALGPNHRLHLRCAESGQHQNAAK